ncbi:MAG: hypothetical protein KGJ06_07400 [Pseudomonadota bacterium]|nr:hypothetical protein [Pseudomonadota bacterium]
MGHGLDLQNNEVQGELKRMWNAMTPDQKAAVDYAVDRHLDRMQRSMPDLRHLKNEAMKIRYKQELLADIYTAQVSVEVYEQAYKGRPQTAQAAVRAL